MILDIILIGPIAVGKSTLGKLLAEKLNLTEFSLDESRWDFYKEIGYSEELTKQKEETERFN